MVFRHPNPKIQEARAPFNKLLESESFQKIFEASQKIKNFLQYDIQENGTRNSYRRALKVFFCEQKIPDIDKFLMNPEILSNGKKIAYKDNLEQRVKQHNDFLVNTLLYEGNTINVHINAIQSLFESNKIELGNRFWKKLKENGKGTSRVTDTKTPNRKTLREILDQGDTEAQASFLIMMNTNARIDQIPTLEWSNIQDIDNEYPLVIYYPDKNKTKRFIKIPITPETRDVLLQYRKQRKEIIEARKNRTGSPNHQRKNELDENKIFPMCTNNLEKKWTLMCIKSDHFIPDPRTGRNQLSSHCLRRFYEDNFGDRNLAKLISGKGKKVDEAYFRKSDDELRKIYAEHANNITVLREPSENTLLTQNLQKELNETQQKYQKLLDAHEGQKQIFTDQKKAIDKKLEQLDDLTQKVDDLEFLNKELKTPEDFVNMSADTLLMLFEYWKNDLDKGNMTFWTKDREDQLVKAINMLKPEIDKLEKKYRKTEK